MKLKKEEKNNLSSLVESLINMGKKFNAIYKQELEELYEDYLEKLEAESKKISIYNDKYKENDEIIHILRDCQDVVKNYFEFIDEENIDLLNDSMDILEDIRLKVEKAELDILREFSLSLKAALTFDDAVKLSGLIMHLTDTGKKLEYEYDVEEGEQKKKKMEQEFFQVLKYDEDLIKKGMDLCDIECPIDIRIRDIFQQTLNVIASFKSFLSGEKSIDAVRIALDDIQRAGAPLREILSGHDKELKLVGLVNYLMDTGKNLKNIHATMDGEEAEKRIEKILTLLEDDLKRIESERNTYSIHNESDKIAIDVLELCREVAENYKGAIEGNDVSPVNTSFVDLAEAAELVKTYQNAQQRTRDIGIAQYLIKTGKDLKNIYLSGLEQNKIEEYLKSFSKNLQRDLHKMEGEKKKYISQEKTEEEIPQEALSAFNPIDNNMAEIFDKSTEILNNYIKFIEGDRRVELINESFKTAVHIAFMIEDADKMVGAMQSSSPTPSSLIGEA